MCSSDLVCDFKKLDAIMPDHEDPSPYPEGTVESPEVVKRARDQFERIKEKHESGVIEVWDEPHDN